MAETQDKKEENILDIYSDPKAFHLEMPLYKEIDLLTAASKKKVLNFLTISTKIDAYCIWCDKESVFEPSDRLYNNVSIPEWTTRNDGLITVSFRCARNQGHRYHVYFFKSGLKIRKVGQYPSVADFQIPQATKYRKILGADLYKEFTKGIGLAANGVGIGSFVYLRRIFENLIIEAHDLTVKENSSFDEALYRTSKMDEKVQEVAQSVMFVSPGLDEIGFIWVRGKGVKLLDAVGVGSNPISM
jgi:hypothetical protein